VGRRIEHRELAVHRGKDRSLLVVLDGIRLDGRMCGCQSRSGLRRWLLGSSQLLGECRRSVCRRWSLVFLVEFRRRPLKFVSMN
jgi:hypothetical protein